MHNPALYYFAGAILVAVVMAVLVCRRCVARKKRSVFISALASDVIANAAWFVVFFSSARIYADGWRVFSREAWSSGSLHSLQSSLFDAGLFIVLGTLVCMLPVLGVAFYYEKQCKRDHESVA
jgi:branched-subunit amino acid ABC-type transport system permease component